MYGKLSADEPTVISYTFDISEITAASNRSMISNIDYENSAQ